VHLSAENAQGSRQGRALRRPLTEQETINAKDLTNPTGLQARCASFIAIDSQITSLFIATFDHLTLLLQGVTL